MRIRQRGPRVGGREEQVQLENREVGGEMIQRGFGGEMVVEGGRAVCLTEPHQTLHVQTRSRVHLGAQCRLAAARIFDLVSRLVPNLYIGGPALIFEYTKTFESALCKENWGFPPEPGSCLDPPGGHVKSAVIAVT